MTPFHDYPNDPPYDEPSQTIADRLCDGRILIGYGKRGHGMNGKDADLDYGGQQLVESLVVLDPIDGDSMKVEINLNLYASICEPILETEDEKKQEEATEWAEALVCDEQQYSGEWTGSDYWQFSTKVRTSVPLSMDEYESVESGSAKTLDAIAQRIHDECMNNEEVKAFEESMASLAKSVDEIHKHLNERETQIIIDEDEMTKEGVL